MRLLLMGLASALLSIGCGECEDDFDCPGQSVCTDAVCARVVCTRDTACPPTQRCSANACVPTRAQSVETGPTVTVILERDD